MLLVQGCYEGGEEDYCEFTSDYPSVAEIRRRVRTRTSSLDKSLLFTPLEAEQREELREKFSREAGGGGGERSKLNLHSDAFNYVEESAVCGSQETSASKSSIRSFVITEKAPSWLKAATTHSVPECRFEGLK